MTTYAFRTLAGDLFLSAPEFARPTPVHAQIGAVTSALVMAPVAAFLFAVGAVLFGGM